MTRITVNFKKIIIRGNEDRIIKVEHFHNVASQRHWCDVFKVLTASRYDKFPVLFDCMTVFQCTACAFVLVLVSAHVLTLICFLVLNLVYCSNFSVTHIPCLLRLLVLSP